VRCCDAPFSPATQAQPHRSSDSAQSAFYWHFGLIRAPAAWVLPTHPCMVLLDACFNKDVPARTIMVALALMTGWIILARLWCKRSFHSRIAPRWDHAGA